MLFNSYSYEILYAQLHWMYLQGNIKLLLVTVSNRLKFEIEIVHDLSCHPILCITVSNNTNQITVFSTLQFIRNFMHVVNIQSSVAVTTLFGSSGILNICPQHIPTVCWYVLPVLLLNRWLLLLMFGRIVWWFLLITRKVLSTKGCWQ